MRIEKISKFYSQPLADAYLQDFSRISPFFTYDPRKEEDFAKRLKHLQQAPKAHLLPLATELRVYNTQLGCGEKTLQHIGLLEKAEAVAVVTGQQPGILTGPLFTIYKALGTIQLAQRLTEQLQVPVVPIFWIGADDHDFAEINHLFVPTSQGPRKISLSAQDGRHSVGHLPLPQEVEKIIEQLQELTPPLGWQQEGIALLRETAGESDNLADWFGRIMTFLFREEGLVLINPLLPGMRTLSAPIFQQALQVAPEVDRRLRAACLELEQSGFIPQIQCEGDKLHLFTYVEGQRRALYWREEVFSDRAGDRLWPKDQLIELSQREPQRFSPDVVLRPVVQEGLLPVLAYVAGPGEISYYALLKNIFALFGQVMPMIYPRPNITLVEPLVEKLIQKYRLPREVLLGGIQVFAQDYLKQSDDLGIAAHFTDFKQLLREKQRELVQAVSPVDPALQGMGKENLRRLLRMVDSFEEKVQQRHRKNHETALRQLAKVHDSLCPQGAWQERVFNVFPYIMKYQPQLLQEIANAIDVTDWRHKLVFLK